MKVIFPQTAKFLGALSLGLGILIFSASAEASVRGGSLTEGLRTRLSIHTECFMGVFESPRASVDSGYLELGRVRAVRPSRRGSSHPSLFGVVFVGKHGNSIAEILTAENFRYDRKKTYARRSFDGDLAATAEVEFVMVSEKDFHALEIRNLSPCPVVVSATQIDDEVRPGLQQREHVVLPQDHVYFETRNAR